MVKKNDGIERIWIKQNGRHTSVSLDSVLFDALAQQEGGVAEAIRWVRATIPELEQRRDAGDPLVAINNPGTSRLVQRLAIHHIVTSLTQSSPTLSQTYGAKDGTDIPPALSTGSVDK